jgi:hypothetical protein
MFDTELLVISIVLLCFLFIGKEFNKEDFIVDGLDLFE